MGRFCDPHCVKLLRVPLRTCLVVGTVATFVVGVVLVVLAYRGWTFGLGTHDKPTLVTVALTADALFFGFVAAVLALAAYWSASGKAKLIIELWFNFSDPNELVFKVDAPRVGDQRLPIVQFKQNRASVVVRNQSRYSARNPGVFISLRGVSLSTAPDGWNATRTVNMLGVTELMWDGEIVHGEMPLPLPDVVLADSCLLPWLEPLVEVIVVADGLKPRVYKLPVRGLNEAEYETYQQERNARIANERTELAYKLKRKEYLRGLGYRRRLRRAVLRCLHRVRWHRSRK